MTVVFIHVSLGERVSLDSSPRKGMLPRDAVDVLALRRVTLSNNVTRVATSGLTETRFIISHDSFFHPKENLRCKNIMLGR